MPKEDFINITYSFDFGDKLIKTFNLCLNRDDLKIVPDANINPPDWAILKNFKCPNCPLDLNKHRYCPLAVNLSNVIEFFQMLPSYHEVEVSVKTKERTTTKETTVQIGVGSLLGIIMSCGGCPVIGKLSSLVRLHTPFASLEETEYKVISMYIVAQFLKFLNGETPDWELKKLKAAYQEIQIVNKNMVEQLSDVEMNDTSRNAVVTLSNFAEYIMISLEDKEFTHIEAYINSFYNI
jgi:hypothetical protein